MASQQQRRDNTTHEREMHVEKDIVPKRATKFEELAKATDAAGTTGSAVVVGVKSKSHLESVEGKMRGLEVGGRGERDKGDSNVGKLEEEEVEHAQQKHQIPSQAAHLLAEERYAQSKQHGAGTQTGAKQQGDRTDTREELRKEKLQMPSLEEVTQYRQTAQQNSLDAVRAAEERYAKAKEEAANAAYAAKESAKHGLGAAAARTRERVGATTQYLSEELAPVKETLSSAGQKTKDYTTEKADDVKTGTQRASEYASEKAVQAKNTTVSTTKSVAGYVGEKAVVAKDVAIEKAAVAKDVVVEKAAVAKDVAVEKAAVAAGYAGKVAEGVKDQAVVAGWGVAHNTTEIAVEATKMAGGVVGKAKDVVASAAHKAAELAEVPVVMAKDTAVDAGEKLADYTARKKMEAERYKEEKQLQYAQEGTHPTSGGGVGEKIQEATETVKDKRRGMMEGSEETKTEEGMMSKSDPGVLGAIGETIVEIAQQTSQLVAGPGMQTQVKEKDWPKST